MTGDHRTRAFAVEDGREQSRLYRASRRGTMPSIPAEVIATCSWPS